MANGSTHEQPQVNRNAAQEQIDPDQLTAQGKPGTDYDEIADLSTTQTDGSRNVRVMNVSNDKRNVEGISEPTDTAYNTDHNANASGITNQPLAKEKASQTEVGSEQKPAPTHKSDNTIDTSDLPTGMAEATETVQISTGTVKR